MALRIVELLTATVEGRTGCKKCCGSTKTNAQGAILSSNHWWACWKPPSIRHRFHILCPAAANCLQRKQRRVLVHTGLLFTNTRHPLIRAGHLWSPRSAGSQNCLIVGYY